MLDENKVEWFGLKLFNKQTRSLQARTTKIITVLEVIPTLMATRCWKHLMKHRRVFFFIDNEAARSGLIKLNSEAQDIRRMYKQLIYEWDDVCCFQWISRVPSPSNIADSVSRLGPLKIYGSAAKQVFPSTGGIFRLPQG